MKKAILALVLACLLLGGNALARTVGVSMPTQDLERWNRDGESIKEGLEKAGYSAVLLWAENDAEKQAADIYEMIENGCEALIVAPVTSGALARALASAKEKGIYVLAYDRMLTDTADVDAFTTFDSFRIGEMQAQYIEERLDLPNAERAFTMEIFTGSPDDANARLLYDGAFSVLSEYMRAGGISIPSGESDFDTCAIYDWDAQSARVRMDNLLAAYYADGAWPDIVLCPNDSLAAGAAESLIAAGCPADAFPVITGQDCDSKNVRNILAGYQAMSVFKDTRELAAKAVEIADSFLRGEGDSLEGAMLVDNGAKEVPSYMCKPALVDASNYKEQLIDSGYYETSQIQ